MLALQPLLSVVAKACKGKESSKVHSCSEVSGSKRIRKQQRIMNQLKIRRQEGVRNHSKIRKNTANQS
jgi:hypothetical protein